MKKPYRDRYNPDRYKNEPLTLAIAFVILGAVFLLLMFGLQSTKAKADTAGDYGGGLYTSINLGATKAKRAELDPPAEQAPVLKISYKSAAPFVVDNGGPVPEGFSVDIMSEVIRRNGWTVGTVHIAGTLEEGHLQPVERGEYDIGMGATTITEERLLRMDMSQPFLPGGIGIASKPDDSVLTALYRKACSEELWMTIAYLLAYVLICANIMWLIERVKGGMFEGIPYGRGIGWGSWFTVVTSSSTGYGDLVPKTTLGRIVASFLIIIGMGLYSTLTASMSAQATLDGIEARIQSFADLNGKTVAAVAGSVGAKRAAEAGARIVEITDTTEGLQLVLADKVDAVVDDTSILKYHLAGTGTDWDGIILAYSGFPFYYGASFPKGSPYRADFDRALVSMQEDGTLAELRARYGLQE